MNEAVFADEGTLRLAVFAGVLAFMAALELMIPKRELRAPKGRRWLTNLLIGGVDSALVRLMAVFVIPLAAVVTAMWAAANGVGLFNLVDLPLWLEIAIAVILLDLGIYIQHVASHRIPLLWRLHKVHHTDVDIDVTTAIRFHPIEIGLSMLYKIVLVLMLGPAAVAVVLFEVILNGCAMFNHANIALPRWLDAALRTFLVTPDMHRVHHSVVTRETDSNFGFNLSIWDRVFGTYTAQPEAGHRDMTIGLAEYQSAEPTRFVWSLLLPFTRPRRGAVDGPGGNPPQQSKANSAARKDVAS